MIIVQAKLTMQCHYYLSNNHILACQRISWPHKTYISVFAGEETLEGLEILEASYN